MNAEKFNAVIILISIFYCFPCFKPTSLLAVNNEAFILSRIAEKLKDTYEKNIGVEAKRDTINVFYNSKTNEFLGINRAILIRKEYFYKRAEYTVLKYYEDDKERPPDEYNYRTRDPIFPPLDKNSEKNYDVKLNEIVIINRVPCYEIIIIPKIKSVRHLSGKAYFTVKGLDLYYMEGSLAANSFGLKNSRIQLYFKKFKGASVLDHGMMIFDVHIPFFYPNKRIVVIVSSSDEKLIPVP